MVVFKILSTCQLKRILHALERMFLWILMAFFFLSYVWLLRFLFFTALGIEPTALGTVGKHSILELLFAFTKRLKYGLKQTHSGLLFSARHHPLERSRNLRAAAPLSKHFRRARFAAHLPPGPETAGSFGSSCPCSRPFA